MGLECEDIDLFHITVRKSHGLHEKEASAHARSCMLFMITTHRKPNNAFLVNHESRIRPELRLQRRLTIRQPALNSTSSESPVAYQRGSRNKPVRARHGSLSQIHSLVFPVELRTWACRVHAEVEDLHPAACARPGAVQCPNEA